MKVCTDSCLFGAWVADKVGTKTIQPNNILDIGSGAGLLSLMIAQKCFGEIDAVEIDKNSFLQSCENFRESPWNKKIHAFHADIKTWDGSEKYELIISNPPFFENDLPSFHKNKNVAKHHESLTLEGLIQSIAKNLSCEGKFALLLPYHRFYFFKKLVTENNFFVEEELLIKQTPDHSFFRVIFLLGRISKNVITKELTIKDQAGNYTEDFLFYLKDYYL